MQHRSAQARTFRQDSPAQQESSEENFDLPSFGDEEEEQDEGPDQGSRIDTVVNTDASDEPDGGQDEGTSSDRDDNDDTADDDVPDDPDGPDGPDGPDDPDDLGAPDDLDDLGAPDDSDDPGALDDPNEFEETYTEEYSDHHSRGACQLCLTMILFIPNTPQLHRMKMGHLVLTTLRKKQLMVSLHS